MILSVRRGATFVKVKTSKIRSSLRLASASIDLAIRANAAGSPFDDGHRGFFLHATNCAHSALLAVFDRPTMDYIMEAVWDTFEYQVSDLMRYARTHASNVAKEAQEKDAYAIMGEFADMLDKYIARGTLRDVTYEVGSLETMKLQIAYMEDMREECSRMGAKKFWMGAKKIWTSKIADTSDKLARLTTYIASFDLPD